MPPSFVRPHSVRPITDSRRSVIKIVVYWARRFYLFGATPIDVRSDTLFCYSVIMLSIVSVFTLMTPATGKKEIAVKSIAVAATVAATVLALAGSAIAERKPNQLEGRQNEAALSCFAYLKEHLKDPSSFQVDQNIRYEFGKVLTKNYIYITAYGRGKNTYGAVLEHTFICSVKCKAGVPCYTESADDYAR